MLQQSGLVSRFVDEVGLGKSLLDIPSADDGRRTSDQVAIRLQLRRIWLERFFGIQHKGEHLVIDLDQGKRFGGRVLVNRSNHRDVVSDKAGDIRQGGPPRIPAVGWHIFVGKHRLHARQG